MNQNNSINNTDQKFRKTIRDDIRKINLTKDIRNEYKSLGDFYLNAEKKDELKSMTPVQRWVHKTKWLLKSMFIHLTPIRRILVMVGILFLVIGRSITFDGNSMTSNEGLLGGILILFVLFLELKDKLLAKHELEAGRKVQKELMPEEDPQIEGWDIWLFTRPANEVGGDLIDYLRLHEDECILTIADVAGKGLKAALLTSKLQATIRALATEINSLADLGKKINEIFHRDSIASLFASMLIFRIKSNSGKVNYVNAGHFPPLIIRDKEIKEHPKGDAALGIIAYSDYKEQIINLEQNEIFIAYSDGVFEARNERGEFFGMERFKQLIKNPVNKSSKQIGQYIITQLEQFFGDSPATDDISLIIMKRNF
jgi:serine phosphatase RsbU (regulator of sigma subunit)